MGIYPAVFGAMWHMRSSICWKCSRRKLTAQSPFKIPYGFMLNFGNRIPVVYYSRAVEVSETRTIDSILYSQTYKLTNYRPGPSSRLLITIQSTLTNPRNRQATRRLSSRIKHRLSILRPHIQAPSRRRRRLRRINSITIFSFVSSVSNTSLPWLGQ